MVRLIGLTLAFLAVLGSSHGQLTAHCPSGWLLSSGQCYKFASGERTWEDARLQCLAQGAYLARIGSAEENNFIAASIRNVRVWIGLRRGSDRRFYWMDGTTPSFTKWGPSQPDNIEGAENCVHILRASAAWNDMKCTSRLPYVCEKQAETPSVITRVPPAVATITAGPVDTGGCTVNADLGFIIDASSSVGREDFQKQVDFVKNIAEYFNVRPGETQAAVITIHDRAQVDIRFGDRPDIDIFKRAMDFVPYTGGQRRIDLGLRLAASDLFATANGARTGVPKVLILLTHGRQTPAADLSQLQQAVLPLRKRGVKIIAIGIGTRADRDELGSIVEGSENLFLVQNHNDLLREVGRISIKSCSLALPEEVKCSVPYNVGFLMDSSGSIGESDFQKERDFVKRIADSFQVKPGRSQGSVLSYSDNARMEIRFGEHATADEFKRAVDRVKHNRGQTRIDLALRLAASEMFNDRRAQAGIEKIAIVLTDGRQTPDPDATSLEQAILPLRRLGVRVIAVGIGHLVERDELRLMVEKDDDIFMAVDFDELLLIVKRIVKKACVKPSSVCGNKADLGFIMDASGSIRDINYKKERDFVKTVAQHFKLSSQETLAGVITYSDSAQVDIRLGRRYQIKEFNAAVDRLPFTGGQTRIDLALKLAATDLFSARGGAREGIPKVALVLTDGRQTPAPDAVSVQQAIGPLRQLGVKVIAIGIGQEVDPVELGYIVERPEDIFMIDDFDALANIGKEVAKLVCEGANLGPVSSGRPMCENKADIGILMDASQIVGSENLAKERDFIKAVSESFYLEQGESRAALITYNDRPRLNIRLGERSPVGQFHQAVDSLTRTGGGLRIDRALRLAGSDLFGPRGGVPRYVPKLMLVISGGRQTLDARSEPLERAVKPLHALGVKIVTVGVSQHVDPTELRLTVEADEDLFLVNSYDELLKKADEVSNRMCYYTEQAAQTKRCHKKLDIAFALDSSKSLQPSQFDMQKEFVKRVSGHINLASNQSRTGAIVFADHARMSIALSQFRTLDKLKPLIDALLFQGGRTRIDKALGAAVAMFSKARAGRSNVPQVLVILTDGRQTIAPDMVSLNVAVEPLRRAGVKIIAVGIGSSVSYNELATLAHTKQDIFLVQSFEQLMTAVDLVQVRVCEA